MTEAQELIKDGIQKAKEALHASEQAQVEGKTNLALVALQDAVDCLIVTLTELDAAKQNRYEGS